MANISPEKQAALNYVADQNEYERRRILSYRSLRYSFTPFDSHYYYTLLFNENKALYRPQKDASSLRASKEAGISKWEYFKSRFNPDKKKIINEKIEAARIVLQEQIDTANAREWERCNEYNEDLRRDIQSYMSALQKGNPAQAKQYFSFVLSNDDYSVDDETRYSMDFDLSYHSESRRLIVDYRLPSISEISDIKEWKVKKDNSVEPKSMNKKEYSAMYEKIILDISIRVISLLAQSDDLGIIKEFIFNGLCVYEQYPNNALVILSVAVPRSRILSARINKMDFNSKSFFANSNKIRYIGDIASDKPANELMENPPLTEVKPIQSNIYLQ